MRIEEEIEHIFNENIHRLTHAMVVEIIDEMLDIICQKIVNEMELPYEDVEAKVLMARAEIIKKLEQGRKKQKTCQ